MIKVDQQALIKHLSISDYDFNTQSQNEHWTSLQKETYAVDRRNKFNGQLLEGTGFIQDIVKYVDDESGVITGSINLYLKKKIKRKTGDASFSINLRYIASGQTLKLVQYNKHDEIFFSGVVQSIYCDQTRAHIDLSYHDSYVISSASSKKKIGCMSFIFLSVIISFALLFFS